jgi:acetyl-CoA carboxylase beta subunit
MLKKSLFIKPKIALDGTGARPAGGGAALPCVQTASLRSSWEENLQVCPWCGHHLRISARRRIAAFGGSGHVFGA